MPRLRRALLALGLLSVLAPASASARSSDVVEADVRLRLAADSSLIVSERLTFDYRGSFEGSYRDIPLLHGERIADVSVSEDGRRYEPGGNTTLGSHDRPGVFGATPIPDGARIVWHYRASDELRTFEVSYRVLDAAVAYDDVIDVGWAVWGDQWDFDLETLRARLTDAALDPDDAAYRVWGHPREAEGETVRGDGVATLAATDVRDGTAVELRVTVPRTAERDVSGARAGSGDGLERILAEERALDEDFNSFFSRAKRWIAEHALWLAIALALGALATLLLLAWLARERPTTAPKHLPEPPDDASPALAYALAHEGGDSKDAVLATLLDLVDRGYFVARTETTEKEKLDLALSKNPQRPDASLLEPHEREVLGFFDELLEDDTVALSEMRERIPEHSSSWRSRWESMTAALNEVEEGRLSWDLDLNGRRWVLAGAVMLLFGALVAIDVTVEEKFLAPLAIGLVTLLVVVTFPGTRLKRLSVKQRERGARWSAFARWTEDFPRLEDDPPATLELWKRILVYGVAFGTAERMIASGRIPTPVHETSGYDGHWSSYAFAGSLSDSSFDGDSFSSGFSSQVAPESSSGGGGGFSGGGGGFSGGGGGGSW